MNNRFCPTCGNKIVDNKRFCDKCGEKVEIEKDKVVESEKTIVMNNSQQTISNNDDKGTMLGLISLLLFYVAPLFLTIIFSAFPKSVAIFSDIVGFCCVMAGVVIMIVGVVKYPKNKVMIANMWIIIGTILAYVFLILTFIVWVLTGQFQV